jgi:hypothetical protein
MKTLNFTIPDTAEFAALRSDALELLAPLGGKPCAPDADGLNIHVRLESSAHGFSITRDSRKNAYLITAGDAINASHGFHHLLRMAGFGFSFFADVQPDKFEVAWPKSAGERITLKPEFSVRGLLPWHNFLNSPTVWNPEDFEGYFKTLWRWGGNTAIFRNYDEEPLAAFRDPATGKWRSGRGMETTLDAPWGGIKGIKVEDFAHGSGKWFPFSRKGAWGAHNAFAKDPIAAAQQEFAQAAVFGAGLGLNIVFGFQLDGDPTWHGYPAFLKVRLQHVLKTYPAIGTLCLLQQEGNGVTGWREGLYSAKLGVLEKRHGKAFDDLKVSSPARYREGLRLAEVFSMACKLAREIRPDIRIAFCGWGGDRWMRWGDYWRGLHRILPQDVILAQLDNIMPHCEDTVSPCTAEIAREREVWTIPWVESDGGGGGHNSQWHPQDAVGQQAKLAKSAKASGYQGLLGIHWQTAGCEINAMHLVRDAGWKVGTDAPKFYSDYAATFFAAGKTGNEVAAILEELEALGASWTGAGQQTECSLFSWEAMPRLSSEADLPREMAGLENPLWAARNAMFETSEVDVPIITHFDNLLFRFATQKLPVNACERLAKLRLRFSKLKLTSPHARRLLATMDFVLAYEAIKT